MTGRLAVIFCGLIACWEKTEEKNPEAEIAPTTEEAAPEPAEESGADGRAFPCADTTCTDEQYCYQFYPGVFDTAGPPDPYCETMPAACENDYSCDCLVNLGLCMDCSLENGGIYCLLAGAK